MWILESSGDFLQGKRMWLKPGQKYLFGRVKRGGVRFAIDHKTVSRKHFIIEVSEVKDGDEARLHARTKITITDQKSKSGTYIDGELIKGSTRELKDTVNSIRPGSCPHELVVKWQPCVLTFNLQKKELKNGLLKTKQDRVRHLDVKVIGDFVTGQTTHVVAAKRNTGKGLQALVSGVSLVDESYIDALEYASTPRALDEDEEELSLLEFDFKPAWPTPRAHLPAPGKESATQSVEAYQPNLGRATVFDGYTFVFCDLVQFETLMPAITAGHGKALLFELVEGQSSADDIVRFMRNAAGDKGPRYSPSGDIDNVLFVRWISKSDPDWAGNLVQEISERTGKQPVDQGDFLNAILVNDASVLKVKFTADLVSTRNTQPNIGRDARVTTQAQHNSSTRPDPTTPHSNDWEIANNHTTDNTAQTTNQNQTEPSQQSSNSSTVQAIQRPRFRAPVVNRPRDFDDGFDADSVQPYESSDSEAGNYPTSAEPAEMSQNGDNTPERHVSDRRIKNEPLSQAKKRPRIDDLQSRKEMLNNDLDELLPATTAMKRRKLALQAEHGEISQNTTETSVTNTREAPVKKSRKEEKEIDVFEIAKAQREAENEAAEREREQLQKDLSFDQLEKGPANLAVVVTMDMPMREKRSTPANGQSSDRWDSNWNGRKNFKKFKRQGQDAPRRGQNHVIVPLVEVKKKTFGLGEQYWEKSQEEKDRIRAKKKQNSSSSNRLSGQTRSKSADYDDSLADEGLVEDRETDDAVATSPTTLRLQREAAEILDHPVDIDAPRQTRAADSRASSVLSVSQVTNKTTTSKRAAKGAAKPAQQNKRQKTLPVTVIHNSDSEDDGDSDDLKFKFGSRRRKAGAHS